MATRSSKMGGSAGAVLDYLKDADRTLSYYSDDGAGPAFERTWGKLGETLGVTDGISSEQWSELFEGRWDGLKVTREGNRIITDPTTGEQTIERTRTPGIDIVFAVPKGVSELYARAATQEQADAIGRVVLQAAKLAWTEGVQNHARVARVRINDGSSGTHVQERVLADLLCTPALQFTARPTQATVDRDAPSDPHLHVHAFTFTAAQVDGRWYTIDEAGIKRTAEYRDQLFMGEVARGMEGLGYAMDYVDFDDSRSGRVTYEPSQSDDDLRTFWSSNHERTFELSRKFEEKYGRPPTDREMSNMMRVTRGKKADKEMDSHPTREWWIDDARRQGHDAAYVERGRPIFRTDAEKQRELYRRLMSPKGLVREDATFNGEQIRPAVVRCAVGLGMSWDELTEYEAALREQLIVVRPAVQDRFQLYTTTVQLAKEGFITTRRFALTREQGEALPMGAVAMAIGESDVELDKEQQTAVVAACSSARWTHVTGFAGSGKSKTAVTIARAHRHANQETQVIATAVSAKTANDFGQKVAADRWGSVESILRQVAMGKIAPTDDTVIMIDEAAMMDTHRMAELLRVSGRARIVMFGDDAQLLPIGAAGWYSESLVDHGAVSLTKVHRHRDAVDVGDYKLIREGRATEAVTSMNERGRIHVATDKAERLGAVMADYRDLRLDGYTSDQIRQVIETSNHDVDLMNRFVQRDRIARGEIINDGFQVEDQEQGRRWTIYEDDQVIFLRPYYERGSEPIRNGTTATVTRVDRDGTVLLQLKSGETRQIFLKERSFNQPLGLAYALHAQKIQGGEVEQVQVLPSPHTASANSGYSQLTRAKHEAHVYLATENSQDPVADLAKAWERVDEKRTAQSYQTEDDVELEEPTPIPTVADVADAEREEWLSSLDDETRARVEAAVARQQEMAADPRSGVSLQHSMDGGR